MACCSWYLKVFCWCSHIHSFCSCAAQPWTALVHQQLSCPSSAFEIIYLFTGWPWELLNCVPAVYTCSGIDGVIARMMLNLAVQSCLERIGWWAKVIIAAAWLAAIACRRNVLGVTGCAKEEEYVWRAFNCNQLPSSVHTDWLPALCCSFSSIQVYVGFHWAD